MTSDGPRALRERIVRALDRADRRWGRRRLFLRRSTDRRTYRRVRELSRAPILIGGCGRSGTSMLVGLLSCHPQVHAIERETHAFCPTGYEDVVDLEADFVFENVLRRLVAAQIAPGRTRWCEKTPKNVHFAERALRYLGPGARFLHLVRDGRDVVTSRHRLAPDRYWIRPQRWIDDVAAGRRIETHPRVLTTRYEDLVGAPEPSLRRICTFLDLPFHADLLRYPATSHLRGDPHWDARLRPLAPTSVGRGRESEHAQPVQELLADPRAADLLRHFGYLPDD